MKQIAIYGKGGIGKSTITANLSVALAEKGFRVLQIGCDPKHDSTRLLLHGFMQTTVLDQLKRKKPEEIHIDEIMLRGYRDICCIEAGGPEPGVGCAGRGIISMASLLDLIGLKKEQFDFVIYDVLGDVVCGGFGVPMRAGYAEHIFVVTSGEMMSIYAANNICKGIQNASQQLGKLAGVIGNARNVENEQVLIADFSQQVGTRMIQFFPRHDLFRQSELLSQTIMEYAPGSDLAELFRILADTVMHTGAAVPRPLSEDGLEQLLSGFYRQQQTSPSTRVVRREKPEPRPSGRGPCDSAMRDPLADARGSESLPEVARPQANEVKVDLPPASFDAYFEKPTPVAVSPYLSKSVRNKEPLHSCALQGAFNVTSQVLDAVSIMHSSINCSHIGFHAMLSVKKLRPIRGSDRFTIPNLFSSNMGETEMIFGGEKLLARTLTELKSATCPAAIFLINSCPGAIIGDDLDKIADGYGGDDCPVIAVKSDGVNEGDYAQGMLNAYMAIAEVLVDKKTGPEGDLINLVGEKNASSVLEENYSRVVSMLSSLGVQVNCRFVSHTDVQRIRQLLRAPFSFLMERDDTACTLRRFLEDRFSLQFLSAPPPVGLKQTEDWINQIALAYGREKRAKRLISEISASYSRRLETLRPVLKGKRVLIFTYLQELDWLLETILDLGMNVEKLCLYNSCIKQAFSSRLSEIPAEINYSASRRDHDIEECRPDLVLSNYLPSRMIQGINYAVVPLCPRLGWSTGLDHAELWARNSLIPFVEGWRHDQKLFSTLS